MSELTAKEWYESIKEDVETPHFTKLTSTGISTDYQSIFEFAEAYYEARQEANGLTKKESNLPLHSVSGAVWVVQDTINGMIAGMFYSQIKAIKYTDKSKGMAIINMEVI